MKFLAGFIITFLVVLCMEGCSYPACQGRGHGHLSFYGFDSAALEKVVIKRFAANNNFSNPIDSALYLLSSDTGRLETYDPVNGFIKWPYFYNAQVTEGEDISIDIPNAGRIYLIKDVVSTHSKSRYTSSASSSDGHVCYNVLQSYNINGSMVSTGSDLSYGLDPSFEVKIER